MVSFIVVVAVAIVAVILMAVLLADSGSIEFEFIGIVPGAFVVLLVLALWSRAAVRIQVDDRLFRLQLWPLPFKSKVPREAITLAYVRQVRPLRQYGGWGVRTRRRDVLYSVGGTTAVTVEFHRNGTPRKLSVTTDRAEELLAALSA